VRANRDTVLKNTGRIMYAAKSHPNQLACLWLMSALYAWKILEVVAYCWVCPVAIAFISSVSRHGSVGEMWALAVTVVPFVVGQLTSKSPWL